ncbi:MAG: hypothetical protein WDO15_24585 [Bacteroidota bacterium]
MKIKYIIYLFLFVSCKNDSHTTTANTRDHIDISNEFVDAFYSFNSDTLAAVLSDAKQSHPEILYYQKWAECGHYKIVTRHGFIEKNDSLILCPVTVKDDLMAALKIDFNVTDTFHVTIREGRIRSVTTSSNDPDEYYQAKEWVKKNRPAYVEKQCEGIWDGGPTPCECIQGMIKGFSELAATEIN